MHVNLEVKYLDKCNKVCIWHNVYVKVSREVLRFIIGMVNFSLANFNLQINNDMMQRLKDDK